MHKKLNPMKDSTTRKNISTMTMAEDAAHLEGVNRTAARMIIRKGVDVVGAVNRLYLAVEKVGDELAGYPGFTRFTIMLSVMTDLLIQHTKMVNDVICEIKKAEGTHE